MTTNAPAQISRTRRTSASIATIWSILTDSRQLCRWAPPVQEVSSCNTEGEGVGSVRHCVIELAGKRGMIVERVTAMEAGKYISYVVDEDSFGMSRMFAGYGFTVSTSATDGGTLLKIETFYKPRNPLYAVMNAVMMRPQFVKVVDGLLEGLANYAESAECRGDDGR